MDKTEIVNALHAAAAHVNLHGPDDAHRGVTAGFSPAAAGIPGWLLTILQLVGPAVLQAIQQWLQTVVPPTPKPGK